jgi:subtilisin family serine protease
MGTSFAAPLVSGAAALIKARAEALAIDLTPTSIEMILENTARTFPTGTDDGLGDCTTGRCGAGILDVYGAVIAVANGGLDSVPNPFTLRDRNDVARSTFYISNTITITGIDTATTISISGNGEYSIDNGSFTKATGTINADQDVRVRLRSPAQAGSTASTQLTIGGITDTFSLRTSGGGGSGGGGEASWLLLGLSLRAFRRRPAICGK